MPHFVGPDMSQKTTALCVVNEHGSRLWQGDARRTRSNLGMHSEACRRRRKSRCRDRLDDASARSWPAPRRVDAVCLDAKRLKAALQMRLNKTDQNDAEGLAHLMRTGWPGDRTVTLCRRSWANRSGWRLGSSRARGVTRQTVFPISSAAWRLYAQPVTFNRLMPVVAAPYGFYTGRVRTASAP
jgi:transposase